MYHLTAVPAFEDNYIWILANLDNHALIVDPGESLAVIKHIEQNHLLPKAILLTHHHADHINGVATLLAHYPNLHIYGPKEVCQKLPEIAIQLVEDNQFVSEIGLSFKVLATPGHTLGHVCYYTTPYLFCGDVLFSAGCGRIFEGTATQMYNSLNRLASLDNKTLICCAHEYTLGNLKFAHYLFPNDEQINIRLKDVIKLREYQQMTLPTEMALEKKTNIFLRCEEEILQHKFHLNDAQSLFAYLRKYKDTF